MQEKECREQRVFGSRAKTISEFDEQIPVTRVQKPGPANKRGENGSARGERERQRGAVSGRENAAVGAAN